MKKINAVFGILTLGIIITVLAIFLVDPSGGEASLYDSGIIALLFKYPYRDASLAVQNVVSVLSLVFSAAAGYFIGSINFALIISYALHNKDIRKYGSKNAGMTNMMRVFGKRSGLLTLLGDVLKTAAPIFVGRFLCGETGAYVAALFCILGHTLPVYYKFRGGKGVISSAIAVLLLDWQIFVVLIIVFIVTVLISKFVSLGSVLAAFAYPGLVFISTQIRMAGAENSLDYVPPAASMLFAFFVGFYVILMHRQNIRRIFNKEENKIDLKKIFNFKKDKQDK